MVGKDFEDMSHIRIRWQRLTSDQKPEKVRILHLKQSFECTTLCSSRLRIIAFEVPGEHDIEFPHAAPAAPAQSGDVGVRTVAQCLRSAIIFLMSAIAFAGFKSFGQDSAQFMIVWQRYRRNGSSSASSRSPVASSRVSMIQR
jgi:hypothetical protein